MYSKIFLFISILFFTSCGAIVNLSQNYQPKAYTRVSNSVFLNPILKNKKIHIIVQNSTSVDQFNSLRSLIAHKIGKNVKIVENPRSADIILYIVIKQFSLVNINTLENIEKYWNYSDTTDITAPKEINSSAFVISDKEVGMSNTGGHPILKSSTSNDMSIVQKISKNDFLSGAMIGGAIGFWVGGTGPFGAAIGALSGGTATLILQNYTSPFAYVAFLDIQISQKTSESIDYYKKYLQREDDSGIVAHEFSKKENLNHKRIKMHAVLKRSFLEENEAAEIINIKLSDSIAHNING